ncbi:hypothetical protein [Nocardia shimofusensis]|uniref:hypothetical protein n=1 Tax=Nocardia shimofusensis TaxID=228596 RepID=UPI0012EDF66B|nr:hypothetical protein [Nocardia shimofusensis]
MGPDEQLGLDFEVQRTAWGDWVDPERRKAQARKFMDRAGIARIPNQPWGAGAPEVQRLNALVAELFPDMETATKSENAATVDEFICFVGECYIKFARAEWFDFEWHGREHSLYDSVNPALRWLGDETEEEVTAWELMESVAEHAEFGEAFSVFVDEMREEYARLANSGISRTAASAVSVPTRWGRWR